MTSDFRERERVNIDSIEYWVLTMGSGAGGRAGGGRPPQILEENFSIHSAPPPDFGGFCNEMF